VLRTCSAEYPSIYGPPLHVEQDPTLWWRAFAENCRSLLADAQAARIAVVSVSGHTPSALPVDDDGNALRHAIIWMDRRSQRQVEWLRERRREIDVERLTANRLDATYTLPKLLWIKDNERSLFDAARCYLQSNGYVVHKLTGRFSVDATHCTMMQLVDAETLSWSEPICRLAGLQLAQLPPIYRCDEVVGEVTREAAAQTGLRAGTPVIAGCNDGVASALGAGLVSAGQCFINLGQAGGVGFCTDAVSRNLSVNNFPYAFPGSWFSYAAMAACGASLRWAKDTIFRAPEGPARRDVGGSEAYRRINEAVASLGEAPGRIVFLPYMLGERSPIWDPHAKGVFFGLTLAHNNADLLKAIMEGTAFSFRHVIEDFGQSGCAIPEVTATGGGARSRIWCRIISDVIGRPVRVLDTEEDVTVGGAVLASYSLGIFSPGTPSEQIDRLVRQKERFDPDLARGRAYSELYSIFRDLYASLKGQFPRLDSL